MGIGTIGELAHAPVDQLRRALGKQGRPSGIFANGRNADPVRQDPIENKGYGNSATLPRDDDRPAYGPSGAPESV